MALVLLNEPESDFHLRVTCYRGNAADTRRYGNRVDDFLEDLYDLDPSGRTTVRAPLEFKECRVSEHAGHPAVLIKFQLCTSANGLTLDDALADLCQKIFNPNAYPIIRGMSSRSILGFSAISSTAKRHWNTSFFRQMLSDGKAFLRAIEETFDDAYLPDWALASSFASLSGLSFLSHIDPAWNHAQAMEAFNTDCITIATSILTKFSTRTELANPGLQQRKWDESHREFKLRMGAVMEAIAQVTTISSSAWTSRNNDLSYANLCECLYDATVAAAKAYTARNELLVAFVGLRQKAVSSMIGNGLAAGAYLTSMGSAFSVTTTTAVLPIAQWGLTDAAALLFLGEVPIVQTTTLWICPPLAMLSLAGVALSAWFAYEDNQKAAMFEKKVEYYRKLAPFISRAWGLAHDTHTLLRWVLCNNANPMNVDFVDNTARLQWQKFITGVNDAIGRRTTSLEFEPRHVLIYLREQGREFQVWRRNLESHEAQLA